MEREHLYNGEDLEELEAIDLVKCESVTDLLQSMAKTSFGGRRLGEAADVLATMIKDKECFRVLTLSGAMTPAKQSLIICEMIDRNWINAIVSTGALMCHGLVEGVGMKHYKPNPKSNDIERFKKGYNRIYDTIELEINLNALAPIIHQALKNNGPGAISSFKLCELIGQILSQTTSPQDRAILKSAWEKKVPIYIPAFTDSELAFNVLTSNLRESPNLNNLSDLIQNKIENFPYQINSFLDLWDFFLRIIQAERIGIFTVGGGVPRNWAQQIPPMLDYFREEFNWDLPIRRYSYGVRICPEPAHWGGLSGCTYEENKSWGKFEADALTAEVYADATIALPILIRTLVERFEKEN